MKMTKAAKFGNALIVTVLIFYTFFTLLPFYFLAIRAFVPTVESTKLHLWFPKLQSLDMNSQLGNFATYFNLDIKQFGYALDLTDHNI